MKDNSSGLMGKHKFLSHLMFQSCKISLMRITNRGHHNHIGLDHALQTLHLSHLGDTRLDECHIFIALDHEQRQSHSQLRVITHR